MNYNLHQAQSHDILRSWQSQRNDVSHHKDFVLPMFIGNDDDARETIESMPDVYRYGGNRAIEYLEPLVYSYGLRAVLLFPVVTKSDQENLKSDNVLDDDDVGVDDNDDVSSEREEFISSSDSSSETSKSIISSSSSATTTDKEDRIGDEVMPERLLPEGEKSSSLNNNNSQNPFLNQNEEEEDHLLVGSVPSTSVLPPPPPTQSKIHTDNYRKRMRSLDVKFIKGMALKDKYNPVLRLIPKLREKFPDLLIICDVCLCAFTSTGHCCLFEDDDPKGLHNSDYRQHSRPSNINVTQHYPISNKITCQYLAMLSVEYALRGCNVVAPSDMMDGRIMTIREKLTENKLQHVAIMSYSAKFASSFYGPFRQATNNAPEFGDRRAYQLPPGSRPMALKAVRRDIEQGADFVMVKPALPYLDIVRDIRESHPDIPIAVYQVSGEYAMLKLGCKATGTDLKMAVNESLTAFRRAGATIIITYFTPELLSGQL